MKYFFLILFISRGALIAQKNSDTTRTIKVYDAAQVMDSVGCISLYSKFISSIHGDSTAYNGSGYSLQGWNEDHYKSGKLLHRGYYVDGKVITFKNYFENGHCERVVENPDPLHCLVNVYFENGQTRKQINYYNGLPQKLYEYYENGQPKLTEESDKDMKYYILKKTWYDNGYLKSALELQDLKNKKYSEKNYYNNGNVKEEGPVVLLSGTKDYVKNGTWYTYDYNGKNKRAEKHSYGIKLNSR